MWIMHTILIGYAHVIDLSLQDDWDDVIEPPIVNHSVGLPDVSNSKNYVFRISSVTSAPSRSRQKQRYSFFQA